VFLLLQACLGVRIDLSIVRDRGAIDVNVLSRTHGVNVIVS